MRFYYLVLISLVCSISGAEETEMKVDKLVSASASQLSEEQSRQNAQAEAAREALTALLNGVQSAPEEADAVTSETIKNPRRAEQVRAHESSVGAIPDDVMTSAVRRKFATLRDRLKNTRDVAIVQQELARFVEKNSRHREARIALARIEILLDKSSQAILTLAPLTASVAAKNHPDWQPWFWAGTAYLAIGAIDQARESLDVAVAKENGVVDVWVQLAVLEQELGNHAGALQYVSIAEKIEPRAAAVHLNRAYSLEHLGRFGEALQSYQRFLVSEMNGGAQALRPSVMRRIAAISKVMSLNTEMGSARAS